MTKSSKLTSIRPQENISRVVELEGRILETLEGISSVVADHTEAASA
jgi:hypothetical protein